MGNVISFIKPHHIMYDAVQAVEVGFEENHPNHDFELDVALANLKCALATFEDAQRLGPNSAAFPGPAVNSMSFNRDIKILSAENEWILATALLDTQCHVGNWISRRLVDHLGMSSSISTEFVPPKVVEVSGGSVTACGVVDLDWKWYPQATRTHVCRFFVFPFSDHLDVLFGVEYIMFEKLLQVNESAFAPLVKDKKSKSEQDAIDQAKKRQQEEKAALEERRKKQQQEESKKGGSQQQGN
ncbi:hypothetical protein F4777DRAFT_453420 [Nemania sp. FL0916]|nr:hypothetical protein F4777DRAFT_453420 [Nemania sp. FL0916]